MRKIKLIVAVALLAASTAAKAQFTNTTAIAAKATQTQVQGWGSVYVQWNPVTIAVDKKGEDDISANAFTIGYNKAFGIAKGTPLFVEAGIGLSYMFKTNEEPYEDLDEVGDYDWQVSGDKYSMLSAKVPVSLAYCWSLPNSSVDLIPFVGVDFRINLVGKLKKQFELGSGRQGPHMEEIPDGLARGPQRTVQQGADDRRGIRHRLHRAVQENKDENHVDNARLQFLTT